MSEPNGTARQVRDERLKRHRSQLSRWKFIAATNLVSGFAIAGFLLSATAHMRSGWHYEAPPADQKIKMVVWAYKGKDGIWKSYAEGHPVEPARTFMGRIIWRP